MQKGNGVVSGGFLEWFPEAETKLWGVFNLSQATHSPNSWANPGVERMPSLPDRGPEPVRSMDPESLPQSQSSSR
jgi:hypothetical protein